MVMATTYETKQPDRPQIDAIKGPLVLEFGTNWCGYCQAAQPAIAAAFEAYPDLRHIKVEDGPGRPLGRSFRIKLWPTLVFLLDGVEQKRVTRPSSAEEVKDGMAAIVAG